MVTNFPNGVYGTFNRTFIVTSCTAVAGDFMVTTELEQCRYPAPEEVQEDSRLNPKMWAFWFREFLQELLGKYRILTLVEPVKWSARIRATTRTRTVKREWIFKDWVQKLAAS